MNKINPLWTAYNNLQNEGGEGYNPHPQYLDDDCGEPQWSKLQSKADRLLRILNGTSDLDPRWAQLKAELEFVEAAQKDAFARGF